MRGMTSEKTIALTFLPIKIIIISLKCADLCVFKKIQSSSIQMQYPFFLLIEYKQK